MSGRPSQEDDEDMSRHVDRELLPLLEDRLDEEGRARVAAHLAACERCRARYGELRFSHGLVRELPTARLPDERADAVRAALRQRRGELRRPAARSPWPSFVVWRWLAPIGAAALLVLAVSLTPVLQASPGWPQWRGPARDGKSPETGLLREWPADGPPLAWRADGLGHGFASVSVAGGRIFTLGDLGDGQYVIALEQSTGRRLWATRIGPSWDDELLAPRATPTVDGRRVFAMSTEGVVASLDAATGDLRWRRSLPEEYGGRVMKTRGGQDWKWSESPLVDGERVIVTPGVRDAALVALAKATGEELWRAAIPDLGDHGSDGAGYSSAVISEGAGIRQYVQLLGRGLVGVEAATGRFLWGYNRVANDVANIPTPLASGDYVFAANGYGTGAVLLELVRRGRDVEAREVYALAPAVLENQHGGLILHDGYVYAGTGQNRGRPVCVELATGAVAWGPAPNQGRRSAAVTYADGRLYFRYQDGRMILVEATPAGYREHGSFRIPGARKESWPLPVIAGGRLFLREQDSLYTYDLRSSG